MDLQLSTTMAAYQQKYFAKHLCRAITWSTLIHLLSRRPTYNPSALRFAVKRYAYYFNDYRLREYMICSILMTDFNTIFNHMSDEVAVHNFCFPKDVIWYLIPFFGLPPQFHTPQLTETMSPLYCLNVSFFVALPLRADKIMSRCFSASTHPIYRKQFGKQYSRCCTITESCLAVT